MKSGKSFSSVELHNSQHFILHSSLSFIIPINKLYSSESLSFIIERVKRARKIWKQHEIQIFLGKFSFIKDDSVDKMLNKLTFLYMNDDNDDDNRKISCKCEFSESHGIESSEN